MRGEVLQKCNTLAGARLLVSSRWRSLACFLSVVPCPLFLKSYPQLMLENA